MTNQNPNTGDWNELVLVALVPDGIELYVPSGRTACNGVLVTVNDKYMANLDLPVGISAIPRSALRTENQISIPPSEEVVSIKVEFPPDRGFPHFFSWPANRAHSS